MPPLNRPIDRSAFALNEQWCAPIDITNHCPQSCAYCTRYERHYRQDQLFCLTLKQVEQALLAYAGYPGAVGIIGGEPITHPEFPAICRLARIHFHREQLVLFTAGLPSAKMAEHAAVIRDTFGAVELADKRDRSRHQTITMAVGEICDPETAEDLIAKCWVPRAWCKTVNHKGAFACELMAAIDNLLDGPGGWPVEPGWWQRTQADCREQMDRWCSLCGMCLPLRRESIWTAREQFTPKLAAMFRDHNLRWMDDDHVEIVDLKLTREQVEINRVGWEPWMNRWSD